VLTVDKERLKDYHAQQAQEEQKKRTHELAKENEKGKKEEIAALRLEVFFLFLRPHTLVAQGRIH
jgi:hypothetical protein